MRGFCIVLTLFNVVFIAAGVITHPAALFVAGMVAGVLFADLTGVEK